VAPPGITCIIGVLDLEEAASIEGNSRIPLTIAARTSNTRRDSSLGGEVEVALAVACLDVGQAVPFLGQRPHRLGEHLQVVHLERQLSGAGCGSAEPEAPTMSPRSRFSSTVPGRLRHVGKPG